MMRPMRVIALLLGVGLIVQACGGDDTSSIRVELAPASVHRRRTASASASVCVVQRANSSTADQRKR